MTEQILLFSALIIAAYLLGSVPFGLIFTKISGRGDIRAIGSGNIGATNVLRTGSRKLAGLTLIFDASKGACLLYTSPSPRDATLSRMPSSA